MVFKSRHNWNAEFVDVPVKKKELCETFEDTLQIQNVFKTSFIVSLAEIPGVGRVDHRTKCVSMVAISLSHIFVTTNCWPAV
jgi:hypothetical protein